MYIEAIYDILGNITSCYCTDTLPETEGVQLFDVIGGVPIGMTQARISIDTSLAMEIDEASGMKAVLNSVTGQPEMKRVERGVYIMETFTVDLLKNKKTHDKPLRGIPKGMEMRELKRK